MKSSWVKNANPYQKKNSLLFCLNLKQNKAIKIQYNSKIYKIHCFKINKNTDLHKSYILIFNLSHSHVSTSSQSPPPSQ